MDKLQACAIVIGLDDTLDGDHLGGDTAQRDADDMAAFLKDRGFRLLSLAANGALGAHPIKGQSATKEAVTRTVEYVAENIEEDGILIVFFSGHGFSEPAKGVRDGRAEGWSLYDGNLWDREWKLLLAKFPRGVRVVIVSDSCFSGGVGPPDDIDPKPLEMLPDCPGARHVSQAAAARKWERERERYQALEENPKIDATVLLLAACQANQNACVGKGNGLFTARLLDVAKDPMLSYREMYLKVRRRFLPTQTPFYWPAGPGHGEFGYEPAFNSAPRMAGEPIS